MFYVQKVFPIFFLFFFFLQQQQPHNFFHYIALIVSLKARLHCKSPGQIGGAAWSSGLVEQLKSPGVDDKPSGFIASNEADRLRHLFWLNIGKHQKKAGRLRNIWFFWPQFSSSKRPPPRMRARTRTHTHTHTHTHHHNREFKGSVIAVGGNWMTKIMAKKIENKFSKMLDEDTILRIWWSCDCDGGNWVTKIAAKKIELTFPIFSAAIFVTQFPPSQSRDPLKFMILCCSTILRIYPSQS